MKGKINLNVSGKVLPLTFSLWSLRQACRELGVSLELLLGKISDVESGQGGVFDVIDFLSCTFAHAANEHLEKGAMPYSIRDGYDWVQELGVSSEQIKDAMQALIESVSSVLNPTGEVADTANNSKKKPSQPLTT